MKNLIVKCIMIFVVTAFISPVFAGGVGYIDYLKVMGNYQYAKNSAKEIETKGLEIQKYLEQKEVEFNKLETPLQKKKFEETVQNELKVKEKAFNDFREKKEESVYTKIHAVTEKIRLDKGYDAILDSRSVFSGGIDITDLLIKTLNSGN
ncbi:MAG: OmpH family outer membrane protein [bacterium]|nr:OmpH family outer membrane protein [bacterium]